MSDPFVFFLLSLAAYRLTRLVVRDTFPPVLWLRDRLAGGWRPLTRAEWETFAAASPTRQAVLQIDLSFNADDEQQQRYVRRLRWSPCWLAELLSCPWCVSGWVSAALVVAAALTIGLPTPLLIWPAVWAVSGLVAARSWA